MAPPKPRTSKGSNDQDLSAFEPPAIFVNSTHIGMIRGLVRLTFGETSQGIIHQRSSVMMTAKHARDFAKGLLETLQEYEDETP